MSSHGALNSHQGERTGGPEPGADPWCEIFFPPARSERERKRGSRPALGRVQGLPGLPQHAGNSRGSEPREFWTRAGSPAGLEPVLEREAFDASKALWRGPGPDPDRTRAGPGPDPGRTRPGPGPTYVPQAVPEAAGRLPDCPPTRLGTLSCAMLHCQVHGESASWVKGAYRALALLWAQTNSSRIGLQTL